MCKFVKKTESTAMMRRNVPHPFWKGFDECLSEQDHVEERANLRRFMENRRAGKSYYRIKNSNEKGYKLFWLTPEEVGKRRGDGLSVEEAYIQYHTEGWQCGEPWKTASIEYISSVLEEGSMRIVLHNC